MMHRHGGTITAITAIGHATERKVASWFFIGDIKWQDGTESKGREICPTMLCHDDTLEDKAKVHALLHGLTQYLDANGTWHDDKHARDGRVYRWTPHKPEGRQAVES